MSQPLVSRSAAALTQPRTALAVIKDYIEITKPKHQFVLLTCWASMRLTSVELSIGRIFFILFATGLAVASSHVFNQLIDSDIDAKMTRTKNRPLAAERISRKGAAVYGFILGLLSILLMVTYVNVLSAVLVIFAITVYVPIYTYWLKRRTPWCTLVGGASGAIPTLIGSAAVTGQITLSAVLLYAFMLIWQTPHFFALTLFRGNEYHEAGVPMLAVVSGIPAALREILLYTVLMIIPTILLYTTGAAGVGFLIVAILTGGAYLTGAILAYVQGEEQAPKWGKVLFFGSYLYLASIFISVAIDRI